MLSSRQGLRHRVRELELGLDGDHGDLAQLDPVSNMVIVHVDVLGPVRLRQSSGPFFAPSIIFKCFNIIRGICF